MVTTIGILTGFRRLAELSTDNMKLGDNFTSGSYCFWESRFTLRLNVAKNTDTSENGSNKNCLELNFL